MASLRVLTIAITAYLSVVVVGFSTSRIACRSFSGRRLLTRDNSVSSWINEQLTSAGTWLTMLVNDTETERKDRIGDEVEKSDRQRVGRVTRTAARNFDAIASKPSSPRYTTRKDSLPLVRVTADGVEGDYNHYRTQALSSTPDRAISILTNDAFQYVKRLYPTSKEGDLGENILVDGIEFHSMQVGDRLRIGESVLVAITERIEPCANLCKLPYINNESLAPKDRIKRCQAFIQALNVRDGLRGWYAKVLEPGTIQVGDTLRFDKRDS